MYDYVVIHGCYGHPFENWGPWIFDTLTSMGKNVLVPQFPCINQCYDNWKKLMDVYSPFIDEHTSFIGHSLGPSFILNYLMESKIHVNNLYLVAPFYGLINIQEFDEANKTFFKYDDLTKAKAYFNKAFCLYSDNDPYVPRKMSVDISEQLDAKVFIIPNGGHLNASAGYIQFDALKDVIVQNG